MSAAAAPGPEPPTFWQLLAEQFRAEPERVLARALATTARWLAQGHSAPHRLEQWQALLQRAQTSGAPGREALLAVLAECDAGTNRLRDFHPFAGVLPRETRRRARELCGFRH